MFHTQSAWRSDDGIEVFRALSGVSSLQRFSVVEVFPDAPTYEVKIAFLNDDGAPCWKKFLCSTLAKAAEIVLENGVVEASVVVNSVGRVKNAVVGESILEIFKFSGSFESPIFFCRTYGETLISDENNNVLVEIPNGSSLIWQS